MSVTIRVVDVALDPRAGGSDAIYSYLPILGLQPGDAVLVPLGNRQLMGYAIGLRDTTEEDLGFDPKHLRPVSGIVDGLRIPTPIFNTVHHVAQEYLCPIPAALTVATPPGVKDRLLPVWLRTQEPAPIELKPLEREVLRTLEDQGGELEVKPTETGTTKALKNLQKLGLVQQTLRLKPPANRKKQEGTYRLIDDQAKVEAFLHSDGKKKPAQAIVLMQMQQTDGTALSSTEIRAMAGVTETTIKALITAKLLQEVDEDHPAPAKNPPTPNPHQQLAIEAITTAIAEHRPKPFLLYGVTGSGKTEVFLRATARALSDGRQVLYLVPEIALAAQAIAQLRDRFGSRVTIMHSELTPLERLANWQRIRSGEASIVLGPRSALFAPLNNVGLIIIDEEHEGGYKQEQAPRYHARDVARFLAQQHNCPLVLGSATPSLESFQEAEQNETEGREDRLTLLTLPNRAASAQLPKVHIDDLTLVYKSGQPSMFGQLLTDKLAQTIDAGNQSILFLNRRAYAPFLMCRDCGHQWTCPECAVSLSYHRGINKIKCHHCGYQESAPAECPKCGGVKIKPFGVGTEKVEEAVRELFPQARVARLDRDIAQKKGALEEVIAGFRAGETNVLVGTQLVAKGLDFPDVTLVGVIAADVSLNLPDFRSSERTFQLLSQVAGRAGRGTKAGEVVIQTFNPQAQAILSAQTHDFLAFYQACKTERVQADYPPFCRLVNIVFSGESRPAVLALCAKALAHLQKVDGLTVLGPADCPLERLNGKWRRHLLIKHGGLLAAIGDSLDGLVERGVTMTIDVDPYSLM